MIKKISNICSNNVRQKVAFQGNSEKLGNEALKIGKETAESLKKPSEKTSFFKTIFDKIKKVCIFVFKSVFDLD